MNEEQYKNFLKRYDQFRRCNLPARFWDEERQVLEYVYYNDEFYTNKVEDYQNFIVRNNLFSAFEDIVYNGFYYPFTTGWYKYTENEEDSELIVGHTHCHSFNEVLLCLYDFPESFKISEDEEEFYSKQELVFLRRLQNFLLFIGLKDSKTYEGNERYNNDFLRKYKKYNIINLDNKMIDDIKKGKRNYLVIFTQYIDFYKKDDIVDRYSFIADKEDSFKLIIKFINREIKEYKYVKNVYKNDDFSDNDLVVVDYFEIVD